MIVVFHHLIDNLCSYQDMKEAEEKDKVNSTLVAEGDQLQEF